MEFLDFCKAIQVAVENYNKINGVLVNSLILLAELDKLIENKEVNQSLRMTQTTILFEGFYRHLSSESLKHEFQIIRANRWTNHFGTPTITFLLSFKSQIDQTIKVFDELTLEVEPPLELPWNIFKIEGLKIDHDNNIVTNPKSITHVEAPLSRESTGIFTKTHNPFGGFTTTPCDPVSQRFIEHAALSAKQGGKVLEIGAAFGAATLEAIAKGATVYCNDIDPENLAVVRQRFLETTDDSSESLTGDSGKLILVPGELPNELIGLPEKQFDAILICRVLHFFSGAKIEESLALLSKLLTPNGKIYIVCETPFLKNWQRFIPEFNRRVENNEEWPGEITEPAKYESSGRASSLPKFVHWITKEVLERSLTKAGFSVEHSEYINRKGQFPDDLLLPEYGKESIGAIGMI
ncbi:TPA: class I SAM-dependent methyltransferase [Legionella pneumophila]|nr:class I SAM-dependent methyltransferase [Legionella pneumophila]HBD7414483.1 class I SAM-dependent methyltransferase [Legionella pneumophila]HBD9351591.1 class I SAM-dependent methyltransferase [Legionella pneumophila]HBD9369589.1 class I SAM-dependent methyltransferase [Legionella pneumophila]HBD9385485.1 class I SAM-dependent methyltransferase [Legionella pneumophila]